jgi:hypothetical protein
MLSMLTISPKKIKYSYLHVATNNLEIFMMYLLAVFHALHTKSELELVPCLGL